jgi:hypothetical protein
MEMGIWLGMLMGGDAGDGIGDAGESDGDRTTSSDMAGHVLYTLKKLPFNSGDVENSPSVHGDGYLASCAHGCGCRQQYRGCR